MFTEKQIDEILVLCKKATDDWQYQPGDYDCDWECGMKYNDPPCHKEIGECEHIRQVEPANIKNFFTIDCGDFIGLSNENAQCVVALRNAFPQLAADYRKAMEVVEAAKGIHTPGKSCRKIIDELEQALAGLERGGE